MPCRVLLAGSSSKVPSWARALFAQPGMLPAAPPCELRATFAKARSSNPDVVVVIAAERDGQEPFHTVAQVMADWPTPLLVLHAQPTSSEGRAADSPFRALSLGALDVLGIPLEPTAAFWADLAKRLKLMARVQVVRHLGLPDKRATARRGSGAGLETEPAFPLLAIAASLGGPRALHTLLGALPKSFPAAICICQHITDGFSSSLARWLASECGRVVAEASNDRPLRPGEVLIAPSGVHLKVTRAGRVQLVRTARQNGFRPSCDVLLASAAEAFRDRALGVVLTGMGRDGAEGLLEIRRRGGFTVAQDESSCAVFGMPAAAIELGAASQVLPLEKIASALCERMVPV